MHWTVWALLSAAFAGLTAIFAKVGVEQINSDMATLVRTVIILLLVSCILSVTGEWQPLSSIGRRTWVFLALSGAATGLSWLCYFRALKLGPASGVAPIDKMSVLFVAVFSIVFLGEQLKLTNWLGIGLLAAGAVLAGMR